MDHFLSCFLDLLSERPHLVRLFLAVVYLFWFVLVAPATSFSLIASTYSYPVMMKWSSLSSCYCISSGIISFLTEKRVSTTYSFVRSLSLKIGLSAYPDGLDGQQARVSAEGSLTKRLSLLE